MDPLFKDGVDLAVVLIVAFKVVFAFLAVMISVILVIWFERKVISDMQDRIGPNRAGPWGMLITLADGIKLIFKEDLLPAGADRTVFRLAPYLSTIPAFLTFSIVPLGGTISLFGHRTFLQLANPPIGILFMLAMSSVSIYGVMLAGWSSGSKYPLLGAVRASAQMVSYEAAMGLSVASVVLIAGSLETRAIVESQAPWQWNLWVLGGVPFFIFLIASTAELNRPPFDLVEAEQELVGGYFTEYSSIRFGLFYLAEYLNLITMSGIVVTLFLGGPSGPDLPVLTGVSPVWFMAKVAVLLFGFVWLRATLPRLRYDQLMDLGWKRLIPAALGWLLVIAAMRVSRTWGAAVFAGMLLAGAVLWLAIQVGQRRTDEASLVNREV